jgi:hypothetical protein
MSIRILALFSGMGITVRLSRACDRHEVAGRHADCALLLQNIIYYINNCHKQETAIAIGVS